LNPRVIPKLIPRKTGGFAVSSSKSPQDDLDGVMLAGVRSFARRAWSPPGSRPHVLLPAAGELAYYCDAYTQPLLLRRWYAPLARELGWPRLRRRDPYGGWDRFMDFLPATRRHLTLSWVDVPTAAVPQRWDELSVALRELVAPLLPVTVHAYAGDAGEHGLRVLVARSAELDELAHAAGAALRAAYGPAAPVWQPPADWTPHIAVSYSTQDWPTEHGPLPSTGNVTQELEHVLQVDQDTFPAGDIPAPLWATQTLRVIAAVPDRR
jgi:hypothetical protein